MAGEGARLLFGFASFNANSTQVAEFVGIAHFHSPWALGLFFVVAFVLHSILSTERSAASVEPNLTGPGGKPLPRSAKRLKEAREKRKLRDFSPVRKLVFLWLSAGLILTFVGNAANIITHALTKTENGWWCGESAAIYVCASAFLYSVVLISIVDSTPSPTLAHQLTWIAAVVVEIILFGATTSLYTNPHYDNNALKHVDRQFHKSATRWEIIDIAINATRLTVLLFLIGFYLIFSLERAYKGQNVSRRGSDANETAPLLINGHANTNGHTHSNGTIEHVAGTGNGHTRNHVSEDAHDSYQSGRVTPDEDPAFYKPKTNQKRSWWEYVKGYSLFFPYLWPAKSTRLQVIALVCFILVVAQRWVNFLVPQQMGTITDELSNKDGKTPGMPWMSITILIVLKFLQGTGGVLGATRSILWIPVSQYSYQALTTASFEHVHSLSLDFHLGKRTGEVISALSKGGSINNFLEQITFSVLPMIIDLVVAIVYFGIKFDAYFALIVSILTFAYLYLTIRMATWRADQRRDMTNLSREEDAVKNDSLTSYETVKYFNAEVYEFSRYRNAVTAFQNAEYKVTVSLNVLNISQNTVFMAGLLTTSFIAAYQVTIGQREVGSFVSLLTYMAQLQQPLNFFGSFYRSIQSAMISGERLLELFKEQPTVVDNRTAVDMPTCEGAIRFDKVKFSYDKRKPALEDFTFTCRPGTTTAFVGESGGGKSTIFRLLYRFYNQQDGSIQIDGNDIKDVTIESLRRHIGVVPQDTILFNETLMYNLRYANQDATDEEVYNACRAASIHDKILAFPDGYHTKVGERGLRLSGGEKQRVAIARTIIKNPRIIMLDEATAALDSETEANIQEALSKLAEGRTMLVIAHRLSTITDADQIIVLHGGEVVESGTHQELIDLKGRYANMWKKQIKASKAAEVASQMVAKAEALQKAVMDRPGSSGNVSGGSGDVSEDESNIQNTLRPSLDALKGIVGNDDSSSHGGTQVGDTLDYTKDETLVEHNKDEDSSDDGTPHLDLSKTSEGEPATRP